jgi:hypothetical protein
MIPSDDLLWREFEPLWQRLTVVSNGLLVAGGYGLLLKQLSLRADRDRPIVVRLEDWGDATPRVTKDLDLVLGLDVISSADRQAIVSRTLADLDYEVREPRWQFVKRLAEAREVVVDIHSPLPTEGDGRGGHLSFDKLRVKHKPSLGERGVHGRQNREAAGSELFPYRFDVNGLDIGVPNPVTWSTMKIVAMRDRWHRSQDTAKGEEYRTFHGEQAIKHAQDVCRVIAMTTAEERDRAGQVVNVIRSTDSFVEAANACERFFLAIDGWGTRAVRQLWRSDDLAVIREVLGSWYR